MPRKKSQNSESEINYEEEKMDNKTEEEKMDNNTNIACNCNVIPKHSNKPTYRPRNTNFLIVPKKSNFISLRIMGRNFHIYYSIFNSIIC